MAVELISIIGIIAALVLLATLVMRGWNLFVVAILASTVVAITGKIDLYTALTGDYMTGWANFAKSNFLVFVAGALMGKVYDVTGAAKSIARLITSKISAKSAAVSIMLAVGVLTYGGISGYVVAFAVYPIALEVFRAADLPRRYIPAAIIFGSCTFSAVLPGNPQIGNVVLVKALGTTLTAGWVVGLVCGILFIVFGSLWLQKITTKAKSRGEHFELRASDVFEDETKELPSPIRALIPLAVTLIAINIKVDGQQIIKTEFGLTLGVFLAYLMMSKYHTNGETRMQLATDGIKNAIFATTTAAGIVGFGSVVKSAAGFSAIVDSISLIPGPDTVALAVATNVVVGVCGTASGGMAIAAPILMPIFTAGGMSLEVFHRIMRVSSTALDTLPHCGFVCLIANGVCGESHKEAYPTVFKLSVILPTFVTIVAIVLYAIFPNLP